MLFLKKEKFLSAFPKDLFLYRTLRHPCCDTRVLTGSYVPIEDMLSHSLIRILPMRHYPISRTRRNNKIRGKGRDDPLFFRAALSIKEVLNF